MDEATRARADERYEAALAAAALRDPRTEFRAWMKALKDERPDAFTEARRYFEETVVPRTAAESSDPIAEWIEYARRLADAFAPGSAVAIDPTGRSTPYAPPPAHGALVLHLPTQPNARARVLSLPQAPSPAQRATIDLLVSGKLEAGRAAGST